MKKSIFILSTVLMLGLLSTQAKAQNIDFGIRGGANISKITQGNFDVGNPIGFLGGLYVNIPLYKTSIDLVPEVLYVQKGFETGGDNYRIGYIEIPLKLRVNFGNSSGLQPYVYAGPYVAFKMNTNFPGEVPKNVQSMVQNDIKSTDFGVTVGGGLDFGHLTLGVRYDTSLLDAFKGGAKNRLYGFSVVAGIGF